MAVTKSPKYPNYGLPKAITQVEKIFKEDRKNAIDRVVAVKHIGYGGISGAADKALGTLAQYGLVERTGKGELKVSQLAVDILHPDTPHQYKAALMRAALQPPVFKAIASRFPDGVSSEALRSYLVRENFFDRAVSPIISAYTETQAFLKLQGASESGGDADSEGAESGLFDDDEEPAMHAQPQEPSRPAASVAQQRAAAPGVGHLSASDMDHLPGPGMTRAAFPLAEGPVYLTFPDGLTSDGYEELSEYLNIFLKRAQRQQRLQEANANANASEDDDEI